MGSFGRDLWPMLARTDEGFPGGMMDALSLLCFRHASIAVFWRKKKDRAGERKMHGKMPAKCHFKCNL